MGWNLDSESGNFLTEKTPLKNMLKDFEHHVRWLAVHAVAADQEWILHTSNTRANRLKTVGVTNKHACIKGVPALSDAQAKTVAKCILKMRNLLKNQKQKETWYKGDLWVLPRPWQY